MEGTNDKATEIYDKLEVYQDKDKRAEILNFGVDN